MFVCFRVQLSVSSPFQILIYIDLSWVSKKIKHFQFFYHTNGGNFLIYNCCFYKLGLFYHLGCSTIKIGPFFNTKSSILEHKSSGRLGQVIVSAWLVHDWLLKKTTLTRMKNHIPEFDKSLTILERHFHQFQFELFDFNAVNRTILIVLAYLFLLEL